VRRERTVAPRRAGTKGKGSIRPLCSGGGAIAHNVSSVYEVNFANTKLTMKCKQGI